jgi:uncharacterized membrane-anchored protein YitT (DUF2179 family)
MALKKIVKKSVTALIGSAVLAFGLCQVHAISGISEGGVLGMCLLLKHWLHISPAVSSFVMSGMCYGFGIHQLGKPFILYSLISSGGFTLFYALFEQLPHYWPQLAEKPLESAVVGAVFVGVGSGLCVRAGGAASGDDALAMAVSAKFPVRIQTVYLASDLIVLTLSLSYIPISRIIYSLITVILSGQIIGLVQYVHRPNRTKE